MGKVTVQVSGETLTDALNSVADHVGLDHFTTKQLTAELRDRLASNGQVVKVVPFTDAKTRARRAA